MNVGEKIHNKILVSRNQQSTSLFYYFYKKFNLFQGWKDDMSFEN